MTITRKVASLLSALHTVVTRIEPWGILLAIVVFSYDLLERVDERKVRAWQLVTTTANGNSGKIEALEYLNGTDGFLCFQAGCLFTWKQPIPLVGIDLSVGNDKNGAYLVEVNLASAKIANADFTRAEMTGAVFTDAYMAGTILISAELTNANLEGAVLREAKLQHSNLVNVDLTNADLTRADLAGADLKGVIGWDTVKGKDRIMNLNLAKNRP